MLWLIDKLFWSTSEKYNIRTYESIQKIATVQWDDYTSGCLQDYNYFEKLL